MRFFTYIYPGPFNNGDILVWDRVRQEAHGWGSADELLIVRSPTLDEALFVRLHGTVGGHDRTVTTNASHHPLLKRLFFDRQFRMGSIVVGDEGSVQVRPRIWSNRNMDLRLDPDNVDGEGSAFGDTMKSFTLTGPEMEELRVRVAERPREAPVAWVRLLEEDGL